MDLDLAVVNTKSPEDERLLLRALAASGRDGTVVLSPELHILAINRPALHYLGLPGTPEGWVNNTLFDAIRILRNHAPQVLPQIRSEIRRVQQGDREACEGEYSLGFRTIHWRNMPLAAHRPSNERLIILQDTTEVRLARSLRDDLMQVMTHQLREPLAGLVAALQHLNGNGNGELSDKHRQALQDAVERADSVLSTITEFTDLNQLVSGRMPLSLGAFSVPDLVDQVLRSEPFATRPRALRLRRHISGGLPLAWGDRDLIERVLQQLIADALTLSAPDSTVQVEAGVVAPDLEKIQVTIGNPGTSRLKEGWWLNPDASVEPSASLSCELGPADLGFAFCHTVLEAHGEQVWVSRSPGDGIAITFTLPQVSPPLIGWTTSS